MGAAVQSILGISFFQNTLEAYLVAFGMFIVVIALLSLLQKFIVRQVGKAAAKTTTDIDDFVIGLISKVGFPVFVVVAAYVATSGLNLLGMLHKGLRYLVVVVLTVQVIILLQEVVRYFVEKTYRRKGKAGDPAVESMARTITNILRWVIWGLGSVFILDNLGINVSALMAGIGIGGIAVAMASQAILGDAFSAVSIFLDKPFEVGDFIIVDDCLGTVEHIGVKTTRVRSLSGEQLVLANSDLTKSRIKNYKRMELRRIVFKIGVVYQTPLAQVKKIPDYIRDIFGQVQGVRLDRVHFQSFGDFALIYEIVYFVLSADYNVYMDKQQEINFLIMSVFEKEKIGFAYPTQKLYVAQEKPVV